MAAAAVLDFFSELKFPVSAIRSLPVSTSTPNLVKIHQNNGGRVMAIYVFKWRSAAILVFAEVNFGGISVYGTSLLVPELNYMRICAITTEVRPLK